RRLHATPSRCSSLCVFQAASSRRQERRRNSSIGGAKLRAAYGARRTPHVVLTQGELMYLVRDIMYCKPGKVRPMIEKFQAMAKLSQKVGMPKMRIMTDMCAERYWTIVSEMEVPSLKAFEDMM